jgi:hypothetical protein
MRCCIRSRCRLSQRRVTGTTPILNVSGAAGGFGSKDPRIPGLTLISDQLEMRPNMSTFGSNGDLQYLFQFLYAPYRQLNLNGVVGAIDDLKVGWALTWGGDMLVASDALLVDSGATLICGWIGRRSLHRLEITAAIRRRSLRPSFPWITHYRADFFDHRSDCCHSVFLRPSKNTLREENNINACTGSVWNRFTRGAAQPMHPVEAGCTLSFSTVSATTHFSSGSSPLITVSVDTTMHGITTCTHTPNDTRCSRAEVINMVSRWLVFS